MDGLLALFPTLSNLYSILRTQAKTLQMKTFKRTGCF